MELRVITESEFSKEFHQGMIDRMEVSFHKYGPVMEAIGKIDEIASLEKRVQKYKETGNTEWLMDAANFAMIEYMHKGVTRFRATDTDESPGLTLTTGATLEGRHTATPQQAAAEVADFYNRKGD